VQQNTTAATCASHATNTWRLSKAESLLKITTS